VVGAFAGAYPTTKSSALVTIDIMMPFYGDPAQFRQAVESVLAQTDGDWRLFVVDDRYPDRGPAEWLATLGDPRIRYELNEENLGVNGNFNRCLELVEAEHFVMMGCDDLLEPAYVETSAQIVTGHPAASYFQPGVAVIDAGGREALPLADRVKSWYRPRAEPPIVLNGEDLAVSLLRGNWTYFPSILWRTDAVRQYGFRTDYEVVLDLDLQLRIADGGGSLVVFDSKLFRYRRHSGSVSSWSARDGSRFDEELRFFQSAAATADRLGWPKARRVALNHLSSRLNALTRLPSAVRARDGLGCRVLAGHAFGHWRETQPDRG
jgi:glycosyltransferase involved in cell wall biosynthesis